MIKHVFKRALSLLLAAALLLGLLPAAGGGLILGADAAEITNGSGAWISGKLNYSYNVQSDGTSANGASGSVSVSGNTLTVKAVSSKYVSGCSEEPAHSTTTTVTVVNASSYPLMVNSFSASGLSVSGVQSGAVIPSGGSFNLSITANPNSESDSSSRTATGTATISVTEQTVATVTADGSSSPKTAASSRKPTTAWASRMVSTLSIPRRATPPR